MGEEAALLGRLRLLRRLLLGLVAITDKPFKSFVDAVREANRNTGY